MSVNESGIVFAPELSSSVCCICTPDQSSGEGSRRVGRKKLQVEQKREIFVLPVIFLNNESIRVKDDAIQQLVVHVKSMTAAGQGNF